MPSANRGQRCRWTSFAVALALVVWLLATASCRAAQPSGGTEPSSKPTSVASPVQVAAPSSPLPVVASPSVAPSSAPSVAADCRGLPVLDLDRSPEGRCRIDCGREACDWTMPSWLHLDLAPVRGRPGDTIAFAVKLQNLDDVPHALTVVDDPIAWTVDLLGPNGKDADVLPQKHAVEGCSRYFPDWPARIVVEAKATISMPLEAIARIKEAVSCKEAYGPELVLVRKPSDLFRATRPMPIGTYRLQVHVPFHGGGVDGGAKDVLLETDLTLAH